MSNSYRGCCELGLVEQDGTFVLQQGVNAVRNCVQMLVGYRNGIDAAVSKFVPKPKSKPSDSGFDLERRTKKRANGVFLAMKIKRCRSKANFAPTWCAWRDSNPHASLHENLNLACLPIPSQAHIQFERMLVPKIECESFAEMTHLNPIHLPVLWYL